MSPDGSETSGLAYTKGPGMVVSGKSILYDSFEEYETIRYDSFEEYEEYETDVTGITIFFSRY